MRKQMIIIKYKYLHETMEFSLNNNNKIFKKNQGGRVINARANVLRSQVKCQRNGKLSAIMP